MAENDAPDATDKQSDEDFLKGADELDSDALLLRFRDWWKQDFPRCKEWHAQAIEDFKFRAGDQWDDEDREIMEDAQKRACLEFNQIDPVIDAVTGSEITNRQEVRYIPRQIGAAPQNEVLTEAARWFRDECEAEFEESAAFADAATCGMGWTETRLDYEMNPDGDPKVERVDPIEMVWDGNAKQGNLIDARRIFRVKRKLPLLEAKQKWPKNRDGDTILDDADYDATWASDDSDEESPYQVHFPGEQLKHEGEEPSEEDVVTLVQVQWYEQQDYYRSVLVDPANPGQADMKELTPEEHLTALSRAGDLGHLYKGVKQTRRIYYKAFVGGVV